MRGLPQPKASIPQLPLWNTAVFQREPGATYQGPALIRKGMLKLADLLKDGLLDEAKLTPLAAALRPLYRT